MHDLEISQPAGRAGRPPKYPRCSVAVAAFGVDLPVPATPEAVRVLAPLVLAGAAFARALSVALEQDLAASWPALASELPRPWSREAVELDLVYWRREQQAGRYAPGRKLLQRRWGWTDLPTRVLVEFYGIRGQHGQHNDPRVVAS